MPDRELRLEDLLSRRLRDVDGKPAGFIEEVCAEERDGHWEIVEFRVGAYAWLQRLAGSAIGRSALQAFGLGRGGGYRVPWDRLDLSDPRTPRLRCRLDDLERLRPDPDVR